MQISYHFVLIKITKLQNLKKKLFSVLVGTPGAGRYCPKLSGTTGIFSGTKQGGRAYRIAGRYGIFWPYRPIRYEIDNLGYSHSSFLDFQSIHFCHLVPFTGLNHYLTFFLFKYLILKFCLVDIFSWDGSIFFS